MTHRWPTVAAEPLALEAAEAFGRAVYQAAPGHDLRVVSTRRVPAARLAAVRG